MENKLEFIRSAINDTQSTIRSVDTKVIALLAALLIPLQSIGKIWFHFEKIYSNSHETTAITMGVIFSFLWLISVYTLVRTLSAIDNPSKHIIHSDNHEGSYYGGGIYSFSFLDIFLNRTLIKAKYDVKTYEKKYPSSNNDIISELSFEHLKLIYIRDIKLHRFKNSLRISFLWVLAGITVYMYSKFLA